MRAGSAHASFEHVTDAELAGDLFGAEALVLVDETGIAPDHPKPPEPRQRGDDVLGDAVGKVRLFLVVADIGKWQDRNGRSFGKGGRLLEGGRVAAGRGVQHAHVAGKTIPSAGDCDDPRAAVRLWPEELAQCCNLHRQVALLDNGIGPGRLDERRLAQDLPSCLHQGVKQQAALVTDRDRLSLAHERAVLHVKQERPEREAARCYAAFTGFGRIRNFSPPL